MAHGRQGKCDRNRQRTSQERRHRLPLRRAPYRRVVLEIIENPRPYIVFYDMQQLVYFTERGGFLDDREFLKCNDLPYFIIYNVLLSMSII